MKHKRSIRLILWLLLLLLAVPRVHASSLQVERQILAFVTEEMGLNTAAACGILANIEAESNFRTNCVGDNGTSYGLCQWHNSRFQDLKSFCLLRGLDYTTLEGQLQFMFHELKTTYPGTYNKLLRVPNTSQGAYDAAWAWCIYYERPAGMETSAAKRGRNAQMKYWLRYGDDGTGLAGNNYSGLFQNPPEDYTFYWNDEQTAETGIPGTTIHIPSRPESGTPQLPQEKPDVAKPSADGFLDRFHYVPHHVTLPAPDMDTALWSCLFFSCGPVKKKGFSFAPQWEECPDLKPEDVSVPEELQEQQEGASAQEIL